MDQLVRDFSILLVEDDEVDIMNVKRAFKKNDVQNNLYIANNGMEAIDLLNKIESEKREPLPRVAILDINMPVMNGFDVARWIREKDFPTEMIFLTMHSDEDIFNEAIDLGAKGFVLKDSALTDIVECIKAVAQSKH